MPATMWPTPAAKAAPIPSSTRSMAGMVSDSGSSDGSSLSSSLPLASIWGPLEPPGRHLTSTPTKLQHNQLHPSKPAGMTAGLATMDASRYGPQIAAQHGWPKLQLHSTTGPSSLAPDSYNDYAQYQPEDQSHYQHWDPAMSSAYNNEVSLATDHAPNVSFPTPLHAHSTKQNKPAPLLALADILRESLYSQSSGSGFPHPPSSATLSESSLYSTSEPSFYSSAPVTPITDSFSFHSHTHPHSNTQHPHLPLANRASQRAAIALMLQNRVDMTTICQLAGGPDLVLDVINANPTEFASKLPELHATLRARAVSSLARGESGVDVNDVPVVTTTPTRTSFGFEIEENRRRSMTPVAQRRIAKVGTPVKNQHVSSQLVNSSAFPHTALEANYHDLTIAIERPSSAPLPCAGPGSIGKKGTAEKNKMRGQFVDLTTSSGSVSVTSSPVAAAKRQTAPCITSGATQEAKRASPPPKLKLNLAAAPFHSRSRAGTGGTGIAKEVPSSPIDGAFARNIVPATSVHHASLRLAMAATAVASSAPETFAASVAAHVGNRLVAAQQQQALTTLDDDSWDEYYYQTPPRNNRQGVLRSSKAGALSVESDSDSRTATPTSYHRSTVEAAKPSPLAVRTLTQPVRSSVATRQTDSPTPYDNGNAADGPLGRDDIVRIQSVSFTHAFNAGKLRMFLHSHKDLKHFATFDYVSIPEDAFNAFMGDTEAIWSFRFVTRPSTVASAGGPNTGTCAGSNGRVRTGLVLNASGQSWEFSAKDFLPAGSKALTLGDWVCMQPLDSFVMRLPKAQVDLRFNVVEFNGLVRLQKVVVPPTMSINVKSMGLGLDGNLYWVPQEAHMVAGALVPRFGLGRLEPQMVTIVPRGQGGVWKKW